MSERQREPVFEVEVECSAGYRGEETPRRFRLFDRSVEVAEIVDRWIGEDHRYFKLLDAGGDRWILRYDEPRDRWEIALYEASGGRALGTPPSSSTPYSESASESAPESE
jgi:dipeptidyl aminopeptidase/acylaminoacyl peptidase